MKFFSAVSFTAILALATAAPTEPASSVAIPVDIPDKLPHFDRNIALVLKPGHDLPAAKRDSLEKRSTTHVDYWEHYDKKGRHSSSDFNSETCYAFINGWNDIISSLEVHSGKNCIFFEDYGCDMGSERLYVSRNYIANLGKLGWNDKISSVLCYT